MWCVDVSDAFESEIETEVETARPEKKMKEKKKESRIGLGNAPLRRRLLA